MKKVLLFSILFIFTIISVFAYETIIIKFPREEHWVKGYYKKLRNEAILQYVPYGQSSKNWDRTIIIHSYKDTYTPINTFLSTNTLRLYKINPTARYKTLRLTEFDGISGRCTKAYGNIKPHCEFFRVTPSHEGMVTIHYINRDKNDFMLNYKEWYEIIKKAKFYSSYYRDERILDKAEYFEL